MTESKEDLRPSLSWKEALLALSAANQEIEYIQKQNLDLQERVKELESEAEMFLSVLLQIRGSLLSSVDGTRIYDKWLGPCVGSIPELAGLAEDVAKRIKELEGALSDVIDELSSQPK